jgi:hypothetical protein
MDTNINKIEHIDQSIIRKGPKYKIVLQCDLSNTVIMTWQSANAAARDLNLSAKMIRKCCNGSVSKYRSFIWRYKDQVQNDFETDLSEFENKSDILGHQDLSNQYLSDQYDDNESVTLDQSDQDDESITLDQSDQDDGISQIVIESDQDIVNHCRNKIQSQHIVIKQIHNKKQALELVIQKSQEEIKQCEVDNQEAQSEIQRYKNIMQNCQRVEQRVEQSASSTLTRLPPSALTPQAIERALQRAERRAEQRIIQANSNFHEYILSNIDNYVCIRYINNIDYSNYFISKDGTEVIYKDDYETTKSNITYSMAGYSVKLYNNDHGWIKYVLHKIINQVLMNGKYNESIRHIDGNKKNNSFKNLKAIKHLRILDSRNKTVNQIDPITNQVVGTFRSLKDAAIAVNIKSTSAISNALYNKKSSAGGFKWRFA